MVLGLGEAKKNGERGHSVLRHCPCPEGKHVHSQEKPRLY